tara:strand:- start:126 stop:362 length:237 start_codon:yes stop_codon:yes gene_type:complete
MPNNKEKKSMVYLGSTEINETIKMIEKDGWDAGEILYHDLKRLVRVVGSGISTKSHYEYMRDFLTYLINKEDYWGEEN